MSESFAELFEQSLKSVKMQPGGVITGEVVRIDNDFVVVDAGLKSEGVIPAEQFRDGRGELTVQVGDQVEVVVENMEDGHGETRLSREKAQRVKAWDELDKAFETQIIVKGIDNEIVGQVAAEIRSKRPPDSYKGKGVRYAGEYVKLKAGKTAQ